MTEKGYDSRNFRNRNPRTTDTRSNATRKANTHETPAAAKESPIRFRNAIQRDDAIGVLLDSLDLGDMWGDNGPTLEGYALASKSYYDAPDPQVVIMRAACRLYQLHGGRNGPRNPNIDVLRIWELPSKALSLFGSLMVAMAGGYDDVDDWMDMISPEDSEDSDTVSVDTVSADTVAADTVAADAAASDSAVPDSTNSDSATNDGGSRETV